MEKGRKRRKTGKARYVREKKTGGGSGGLHRNRGPSQS